MPIINENKDLSEQKESLQSSQVNPVNGTIWQSYIVHNAMIITDCKVAMNGVSGSPSVMLGVYRFNAGSGAMSFVIGSSFAVTAYSTSGWNSYSLPAVGSTTLSLQKGDVLTVTQGGGTSAASTLTTIEVVAQNIQDIVSWY